jgi:cyclohexanecarboxylate-CoA ligase
VSLVLFTSGTTGEPKATLHTVNTKYAGNASFRTHHSPDRTDTVFCPHALTHTGGIVFSIFIPLLAGATTVLMDVWDPEVAAPLLAETHTTVFGAAPVFISALAEVVRRRGIRLALHRVSTFGTTIPRQVVTEVADTFGVALAAFWGMTEATGTLTYPSDPPDWAARSVGHPMEGTELDLRADGEITDERPARLHIRGAGVCLATIGRDSGEVYVTADHDDGWYDTGDLAVPDGRGGIRIAGRAERPPGPGHSLDLGPAGTSRGREPPGRARRRHR